MIDEFLTWSVLWRLAVFVGWSFLLWVFSKHYTRNLANVTKPAVFFTEPVSTSLTVVGLLVPLIAGAAAFFVTSRPDQAVAYLLAAVTILLCVLAALVWLSFSLHNLNSTHGNVTLDLTKDFPILGATALVYGNLLLAMAYVALFALFEFDLEKWQAQRAPSNRVMAEQPLLRPVANLGMTRDEITHSWGQPWDESGLTATYRTPAGSTTLTFGEEGKLTRIVQQTEASGHGH